MNLDPFVVAAVVIGLGAALVGRQRIRRRAGEGAGAPRGDASSDSGSSSDSGFGAGGTSDAGAESGSCGDSGGDSGSCD